MNSTFKFKLIQALNKKNGNKGFTLIELLVVVIIIGVLAAIALPNLLGQIAKGRQAEARNNLGTVNRAQQAYRLEEARFGLVTELPIGITGQYYGSVATASVIGGANSQFGANHAAIPHSTYTNDILEYESAVGQTSSGVYSVVICEQTTNPSAAAITEPGDWSAAGTAAALAACAGGGKQIK
ncbi:MAG: prepilin-type N-terminal cleavage/methylation domain-containing protein [Microcystis sp. LE18-22.4A]|uniref:type IV pilin-like G/H family protein n=1 Tax=Microcystis sp. LE18-22.4A TaxID=3016432 RepID=UPI0022BB6B9A|nr:type IV pilin-like G/H family protein [Microcystis sp. LE18-22.4A]MCZ8117341.1 prepilin-type N-terminal cleavage/methylation domain-containing protein [Microcystis sp. LE18-22.4A]